MLRYRTPFVWFAVSVVAATALSRVASHDAQRQSMPPHAVRLEAVPPLTGPVDPAYADRSLEQLMDFLAAQEAARLAAEEEERARLAEAERLAAARQAANQRMAGPRTTAPSGGGDCAAIDAEFGTPAGTALRESHCSRDPGITNPTGCEGYGCVGPVQLHLGHFQNPSPWGGVGACWGLDPYSYADQVECAHRLGPGAWG